MKVLRYPGIFFYNTMDCDARTYGNPNQTKKKLLTDYRFYNSRIQKLMFERRKTMSRIDNLLRALDDVAIAKMIGNKHDDARLEYPKPPPINTYEDFLEVIGDYYSYHTTTCIAVGGTISKIEAKGEAERILQEQTRKDSMILFKDAKNGANGGIRMLLDYIANALKTRSMQGYSNVIIAANVKRDDPRDREEMCKQLFQQYGGLLAADIDLTNPEKYSDELENIIYDILRAKSQMAHTYRRITR